MIPPKLKSGPKSPTKYFWDGMRIGDFRIGNSRESLIGSFKSYFGKRKKKYRFTTRKEEDGTFTIYRTK